MKLGQIFATTIFIIISQVNVEAQVQLMLDVDPNTKTYIVSMLPNVTWEYPNNRTATAQITVKAPTGAFDLKEFTSLTPDVEWVMNSRVNSPEEAPAYDYFSFSIVTSGLASLDFVQGKPTKLFCFKNDQSCSGQVSLMNNRNDPFFPPNTRNINVGNSLGVQGAMGEAYTNNVSDRAFDCDFGIKQLASEEAVPPFQEMLETPTQIFPNPSSDLVNITLTWDKSEGDKEVLLYNNIGELVQFYKEPLTEGANHLRLDVSQLVGGMYHVIIVENGNRISLGKMMKVW